MKIGATCLEKKIGEKLQEFQDPFPFASPNTKMGDIQRVMDGDLDPFVNAYLKEFG